MTDFYYKKNSEKDFSILVSDLEKGVDDNSFKVLSTYDIQETFAGKGIEHGPFTIIEFCRAPVAKKVLDKDPLVGLFLPCKIIVFEDKGSITVAALRPAIVSEFFEGLELGDVMQAVESDIIDIVDSNV